MSVQDDARVMSEQLAELDRQAVETLRVAAAIVVNDVLARLGTKIRVTASRKNRDLRERIVTAVKTRTVTPEVLGLVGVDAQQYLVDAFATFERKAQEVFARLDDRKARLARRYAARYGRDIADEAEALREDRTRQAGLVLSGRLREWTFGLLGAGLTVEAITGEMAKERMVPPSALREALHIASLANPDRIGPDSTSGAIPGRNSDLLRGALGEQIQVRLEWVWGFYGEPARPFPPHENLNGTVVDGPEDELLANPDTFPDSDFYSPRDHEGCLCELIEVAG